MSGKRPDPYRVWLSEVMLQQTTVAAVEGYFRRFVALWPTVVELAAAADESVMSEWAGLGYYARARNLLKSARIVAKAGEFPRTETELLQLPGIGRYTAAAIAAIAFGQKSTVVDGNVERVMARYFAVETPMPASKPDLFAFAAGMTPKSRVGDYAQAVMDLGATICTPRKPVCETCPVNSGCRGKMLGMAARLPTRSPKPAKPIRLGKIWLAFRSDGAVLVERRPEFGLLGGMLALPTSGWDGTDISGPPITGDWQTIGEIRHTFTHFHLRVEVMHSIVPAGSNGHFMAKSALDSTGLPNLFRKALQLRFPADKA